MDVRGANAREARLRLGSEFQDATEQFRRCTHTLRLVQAFLRDLPESDAIVLKVLGCLFPRAGARGALATWLSKPPAPVGGMQLFVRLRPLLADEEARGEYSCSTVDAHGVVVHDGRVARDGRSLYMVHRRFQIGRVFRCAAKTDDVYTEAVQPLVQRAAQSRSATVLLWGQTGTGKTYTAMGVLRCLAKELFGLTGTAVVRAFEMAGTKRGLNNSLDLFDLLNERKKVFLRQDENETVHVRGCVDTPVTTQAELEAVIATAFQHRSSTATERNEQSSRSHMFVEVALPNGGLLRIGDLAGSERNYETGMHSRQRHVEGGDINMSLMMLKDVIRLRRQQLRGDQVHVPYRGSKLTQYLRECFVSAQPSCSLISTISPTPTDVDHTLNTMVHVSTMRGKEKDEESNRVFKGAQEARKMRSRASANNAAEWNVLNRWDKVEAEEDIYQLEGADREALVWLRKHGSDEYYRHDVQKWTADQVVAWLAEQELEAPFLPKALTGTQLARLGPRLKSLGGEAGQQILEALKRENELNRQLQVSQRKNTRQIFGLGTNKAAGAKLAAARAAATEEAPVPAAAPVPEIEFSVKNMSAGEEKQ